MSKIPKKFTVVPSQPLGVRGGIVTARTRLLLAQALFHYLGGGDVQRLEVASALWDGRPVVLPDFGVVIIPGAFEHVSFQWFDS